MSSLSDASYFDDTTTFLVYVMIFKTGAKFNVDLSQNKAHVKILIQEEISKLVDEDDEVEGEEEMDG